MPVVAWTFAGIGLVFMLFTPRCLAHTPSETYFTLKLSGTNVNGRWDVALRDLHQAMGLTPEEAGRISPANLHEREEALALDIIAGVQLRADGRPLDLIVTDFTTLALNGLEYARLLFDASGLLDEPRSVEIDAAIAFRIDTNMHGLLRLEHNGRSEVIAFNQQRATHRFEMSQPGGRWARWVSFVREGAWHIWLGLDHMLFLVVLLLPSVLKREGNRLEGVGRFRDALMNIVKIVTAFTVAHSLTLSLSVLGVIRLPSRLVEATIAASVVLAALNNLSLRHTAKGWWVAFSFGLIHGFGFANVLIGLDLSSGVLAVALIGFNVGVELGQLMVVLLFLPVAFYVRETYIYTTITLKFGSSIVALVAVVWLVERLSG
jgi:hypothetical protein